MKGAASVLFMLIGFELLVTSKVSQIAPAITWVTTAVAKWMDPDVPLISAPAAGQAGGGAGATASSLATGLGAGLGLLAARTTSARNGGRTFRTPIKLVPNTSRQRVAKLDQLFFENGHRFLSQYHRSHNPPRAVTTKKITIKKNFTI